MSFTKFQFKNYIREALEELKFTIPTEVQDKLIPIVLAGRDLVGESKTGSGKTHTFLLPIFQQLDEASDSVQSLLHQAVSWLLKFTKQPVRLLPNQMSKFVWLIMWVVRIRRVRLKNLPATNHISLSERQGVSMTWSNLVIWLFTRLRPL